MKAYYKKYRFLIKRLLLLLLIILPLLTCNTTNKIELVHYTIKSSRLPSAFNGFKVVQISDLHHIKSEQQASKMISMIHGVAPNIIVLTGDIVDETSLDFSKTYAFLEELEAIAPTYAVNGNHEAWLPDTIYTEFEDRLNSIGIPMLHNTTIPIAYNNTYIQLAGVDDPDFSSRTGSYSSAIMDNQLANISTKSFTLLLSHRPELFDNYVSANIDCVLTGHSHGGQIRLPFIGAIIAPDQSLFPKYDLGKFSKDSTTMIVSSGIGYSKIPLRINTPAQIIVVELQNQ